MSLHQAATSIFVKIGIAVKYNTVLPRYCILKFQCETHDTVLDPFCARCMCRAMAALTKLYCDECVINDCLTNSNMLSYFKALDTGDEPFPRAIDLKGNYLGDKSLAAVCTVLSTLPGIEELDLRRLDIQLPGLTAVCRLAAQHRGLRRIDLRDNQLFASSGRLLVELLKRNPRITQCLFDSDDMPTRFVSAIHAQLGRNIAGAHPCTWESCSEVALRVEMLPAISFEAPTSERNQFQTYLLGELEGCNERLLPLFSKCGLVACQFFVDFGPDSLPMLEKMVSLFADDSRDFCLGNVPRYVRVKSLLLDEFSHYAACQTVCEAVDGTLLETQIKSATNLAQALGDDESVDEVVAMATHIRNALRNLRTPRLNCVEDTASQLRAQMVKEIDQTRRLQVVRHEARYLAMDYPGMANQAAQAYMCCQTPLRCTLAELEGQVLRIARHPYAKARRGILKDFATVCPAAVLEAAFTHWAAKALDTSVSAAGLHFGVNPRFGECADWSELIDRLCEDSSAASTLVESVAGCERLKRYREPL